MADNSMSAEEALRRALEEAMANIDYSEEEDDEGIHPASDSASEDSDGWVAPVVPEDLLHGTDNDADSVDEYVVFSLPDDNEQREEYERQSVEHILAEIEAEAKKKVAVLEYSRAEAEQDRTECEEQRRKTVDMAERERFDTFLTSAVVVVVTILVVLGISVFYEVSHNEASLRDTSIEQTPPSTIVEDALVVDAPYSSTNVASLLSDVFSNAYYGNPDTYGILLPSSMGHLVEPVGDSEVMMQIANDEDIVQVVSCSCVPGTHRYDAPSSRFMGTGLIVVEAQEGDIPSAYVWKRYKAMFNKEMLCIVVLPKEELEYLQETLTENDPRHNKGYIEVIGETDEGTMEYVEEMLGK